MKIATQNGRIQFTFGDDVAPLEFNPDAASPACNATARLMGWSDRLRDMAAIERAKVPGGIVTEQMRRDEVARGIAYYESGATEWRMGAVAAQNPIIAAIAAKRGCTYEEAQTFLANEFLAGA